jgi:hypothetical protein
MSKPQDVSSELDLKSLSLTDSIEATPATPIYHERESSLGAPFIVVTSEGGFLKSIANTCRVTSQSVHDLVDKWETEKVVLLADLEGENHGLGGEMHCAQFFPTTVFDPVSNKVDSTPYSKSTSPSLIGLLLDAKSPEALLIMKRIFESSRITKFLWGSDGDLIALRWNPTVSESLRVRSKNVIDVQLAYSSHGRRLGMERAMMEAVPYSLSSVLSCAKHDSSYYEPQAQNRRCTSIPFDAAQFRYSMDDLHRIELILVHKPAAPSSFLSAKRSTDRDIEGIESGAFLFSWLELEASFFSRKFGNIKGQKAVQFKRAIVHLKMVLPGVRNEALKRVDDLIGLELRLRNVVICDLSFAGDN